MKSKKDASNTSEIQTKKKEDDDRSVTDKLDTKDSQPTEVASDDSTADNVEKSQSNASTNSANDNLQSLNSAEKSNSQQDLENESPDLNDVSNNSKDCPVEINLLNESPSKDRKQKNACTGSAQDNLSDDKGSTNDDSKSSDQVSEKDIRIEPTPLENKATKTDADSNTLFAKTPALRGHFQSFSKASAPDEDNTLGVPKQKKSVSFMINDTKEESPEAFTSIQLSDPEDEIDKGKKFLSLMFPQQK